MDLLMPRLAEIAKYISKDSVVADIGTDHGFLPVYLVNQQICPKVIGGDINEGPYQSALKTVQKYKLQKYIDIRLGNGLDIVGPGEVDTVVIAGMGGSTIIDILSSSPEVLRGLQRLILQPMIAASQLRLWLTNNRWRLVKEALVRDEHRIYEIIVAEPGYEETQDKLEIQIGPRLLAEKPPLLREHLKRLLHGDEKVHQGLMKSTKTEAVKIKEIEERIEFLKKVIKCL